MNIPSQSRSGSTSVRLRQILPPSLVLSPAVSARIRSRLLVQNPSLAQRHPIPTPLMASVRRLVRPLSLYSPISHFILPEGTGAVVSHRRCFSTNGLCEDRESKYDPEADDGVTASTALDKIRREFDAAKRSFLSIPATLKEMPKMNPEDG